MIKNKNQLMDYLNKFFFDHNNYNMPKFSSAVQHSKFFRENSKKIIKFINKNEANHEDSEKLILCSYFSSKKVLDKIKILNKKKSKKKHFELNETIFKQKNKTKLFYK